MENDQEGPFGVVADRLCLDFINTVSSYRSDEPEDDLTTYEALVAWAREAGIISPETAENALAAAAREPEAASRVLKRGLALRSALRELFSERPNGRTPSRSALSVLNNELSRALSHRAVVQEGGHFDWAWSQEAGRQDMMLWPVALSAAQLLTSSNLDRVRECAGDTCGWMFIDMSRNRSRQWCDMRECGNRAKARRHYQRKCAAEAGA